MEKDQGVQMPAKVDFRNSQVTLDEANAMLAEFETDKETAMDTLTDGDEGIQVISLICFPIFQRYNVSDEGGREGLGLGLN